MHNFFDVNLFQNIVSGLVVLFVSILLSGNSKDNTATRGQGWKVIVILGWCMILGGMYTAGVNAPNGGWNNPYVGMGWSIAFFGFLIKCVGKFFVWWHR